LGEAGQSELDGDEVPHAQLHHSLDINDRVIDGGVVVASAVAASQKESLFTAEEATSQVQLAFTVEGVVATTTIFKEWRLEVAILIGVINTFVEDFISSKRHSRIHSCMKVIYKGEASSRREDGQKLSPPSHDTNVRLESLNFNLNNVISDSVVRNYNRLFWVRNENFEAVKL